MVSFEVIIQTKTGNLFFGCQWSMQGVAHEWEGEINHITVWPSKQLSAGQQKDVANQICLAYRFPVHLIKFYYSEEQPVGKVEVTR